MKALMARTGMVAEYAWAVPNDRALAALAALAPIVEIGAGGGYWAALLRDRGVDILAYDKQPGPRSATNEQIPDRRIWTEVLEGDAAKAAEHPDRTLFLCWPPIRDDMARNALTGYLNAGGTTLAHVGEYNGATATDEFFAVLEERMVEAQMIEIPR